MFLESERRQHEIYPPQAQVFAALNLTPLSSVRAVILGQDPYHGPGQAHGLAFSVQSGVQVPPSLRNMYTELEKDVAGFKRPNHGYLVSWAKEGVLLLNTSLTVRKAMAASHSKKGWEEITDAVIRTVSEHCQGVVFILWGGHAQKKASLINGKKHHILKAAHPSPLSAHNGT
jgi:uracil-DNA glycosylase